MRVVIDTNILISAFFWGGLPLQILIATYEGRLLALATADTVSELQRVFSYPKFAQRISETNLLSRRLLNRYVDAVAITNPAPVPPNAVRDPADQAILACAVGGNADVIISGDKDLLSLGTFQGIPILSAEQFVAQYLPSP